MATKYQWTGHPCLRVIFNNTFHASSPILWNVFSALLGFHFVFFVSLIISNLLGPSFFVSISLITGLGVLKSRSYCLALLSAILSFIIGLLFALSISSYTLLYFWEQRSKYATASGAVLVVANYIFGFVGVCIFVSNKYATLKDTGQNGSVTNVESKIFDNSSHADFFNCSEAEGAVDGIRLQRVVVCNSEVLYEKSSPQSRILSDQNGRERHFLTSQRKIFSSGGDVWHTQIDMDDRCHATEAERKSDQPKMGSGGSLGGRQENNRNPFELTQSAASWHTDVKRETPMSDAVRKRNQPKEANGIQSRRPSPSSSPSSVQGTPSHFLSNGLLATPKIFPQSKFQSDCSNWDLTHGHANSLSRQFSAPGESGNGSCSPPCLGMDPNAKSPQSDMCHLNYNCLRHDYKVEGTLSPCAKTPGNEICEDLQQTNSDEVGDEDEKPNLFLTSPLTTFNYSLILEKAAAAAPPQKDPQVEAHPPKDNPVAQCEGTPVHVAHRPGFAISKPSPTTPKPKLFAFSQTKDSLTSTTQNTSAVSTSACEPNNLASDSINICSDKKVCPPSPFPETISEKL